MNRSKPFNTCILVMAFGVGCNGSPDDEVVASVTQRFTGSTQTPTPVDYDGDGKVDVALKFDDGSWAIDYAANDFTGWQQAYGARGSSNAHPVPGDYDGDHKMDLSIKTDAGEWFIDYASDGMGSWNESLTAYGFTDAQPVPADYDGDGRTDLSVKGDDGVWYIDYASDGFGAWNEMHSGYGSADAHPVPADYDGDGRADLSIKGDDGGWFIDYAADGFGAWNEMHFGYGATDAHPAPADYDGDGRADLSIKGDDGGWLIDYAADGFGAWNVSYSGYGYADAHPVPGDYDGDKKADLAVMSDAGYWYIDFSADGFSGWNRILPVLGATMPSITLKSSADRSLTVRVTAQRTTELVTRRQDLASSEQKATGNDVTRTFSGLSPNKRYCIEATANTAYGNQTNTSCFKTKALASPPPPQSNTVFLNPSPVTQGPLPYVGSWGPIAGAHPTRFWIPASASTDFTLHFVRVGHSSEECFGPNHANATVPLSDGGSLDQAGIAKIFGTTNLTGVQLPFVACYSGTDANTHTGSVFFNLDWSN